MESPAGIPNHGFSFPENYGTTTNEGINFSEEDICDVADVSGVMGAQCSYTCIEQHAKQKLQQQM